jgi:hypothetical protein
MRVIGRAPGLKARTFFTSVGGLDLTSSVAYRFCNSLHPRGALRAGSTDRTETFIGHRHQKNTVIQLELQDLPSPVPCYNATRTKHVQPSCRTSGMMSRLTIASGL